MPPMIPGPGLFGEPYTGSDVVRALQHQSPLLQYMPLECQAAGPAGHFVSRVIVGRFQQRAVANDDTSDFLLVDHCSDLRMYASVVLATVAVPAGV